MRVLMVGPWSATAMRRHIDWAMESGVEVCAADFRTSLRAVAPAGMRIFELLPRSMHRHRFSWSSRILDVAAMRLHRTAQEFQPHLVHTYMFNRYSDVCLRAGMRPLVISVWGSLNELLQGRLTTTDRHWLRRLRRGAHTLLVENPKLLNALVKWPVQPLQVAYFSIGVDSGLFHPDYHEKRAA